ncbi:hypothetical protein L1987_64739 [Smallanthus sonchifolius]|uniref:Uncharacterized protein n=1 Tax=Smallanthus sonchifolius TaxID=185202 RepID=A0ACB9BSJ2_9ASTR|nr:hypothetical protein L1987_64739 [Smallanthus sonchifolius]
MAASKLMIVVVVMAIASFRLPSTVAQTSHVVGDTTGWTIPPGGNATYITWASSQTFTVGDTLVFNFATNAHDVAEVREEAYGPCTTANPISTNNTGPAILTLTRPGNHYYICTFGTHCQAGQKLTITVAESSTTPAPPGSTTPPSPPAPSSASSFTAVVPITFLAAALAFFY